MKLTPSQITTIAEKVLESWKKHNMVTFKTDEKKVLARMIDGLKLELQKESDLERDVQKMLDDLERSHQGEFQRFKMYPLLKQKLAKERKIIL